MSAGPTPYRQPRRAVFASTLAAAVILGLGGLVLKANDGERLAAANNELVTEPAGTPATVPPSSDTTPETTQPPQDLTAELTATASATAPDNVDDAGTPVSYEAEHLLDLDPSTAWRVEGDGDGVTIELVWPGTAHITEVGLVPGYDKVDPASGRHRFPLNRRVAEVNWQFDDGTVIPQQFEDEPELQTIPVDVTAGSVTIEIVSSIAGHPDYDYTAISDVHVAGWA